MGCSFERCATDSLGMTYFVAATYMAMVGVASRVFVAMWPATRHAAGLANTESVSRIADTIAQQSSLII
jgi:hypothetical protein